MKKRLLCMVLAALMLMSVCAFAEAENEADIPAAEPEAVDTAEPDTEAEPTPEPTPEAQGDEPPFADADAAPEQDEIIEVPAELDGVFQFGDFYGEQLGIDFDRMMMPARAPALISEADDGKLTMAEKLTQIALRVKGAIDKCEASVELSDLKIEHTEANKKAITDRISAALNSVPESFIYKDNQILYSVAQGSNMYVRVSFNIWPNPAQMRKDYDNEKDAAKVTLFPKGTSGMSKTEIALAIHDYIALHTRYDHDAVANPSKNPYMFNAYGALVKGLAVCHGYALAYMSLLSEYKVESYFVSSENINHGWLKINTENGWYHSDVTWDDPKLEAGDYTKDGDYMGYCKHDYFMNTGAQIKENHFDIENKPDDSSVNLAFGQKPIDAKKEHPNSGFWQDIYCGMAYINDKWYYNDSKLWGQNVNGTVVQHTLGNIYSTPYGTERQTNDVIAENATAFAVVDGSLVYGKFNGPYTDAIMCYDTVSKNESTLVGMEGNTIVTEIAAGRLNLNNRFYGRGTVVYADMNCQLDTVNPKEIPGKGDVNADGRIDIDDVKMICGHIMDNAALSGIAFAAADIDNNGTVNMTDAVLLCQMISEGNA